MYGTFAGKIEHMDARSTDPKPHEKEKKNLYTNPPKKGTGYGYIGVTIGELFYYEYYK